MHRHLDGHGKINPAAPLDLVPRQQQCQDQRKKSDLNWNTPSGCLMKRHCSFSRVQPQRFPQLPRAQIQEHYLQGDSGEPQCEDSQHDDAGTNAGTFLKAAKSDWISSGICCVAITKMVIANANAASMKVSSRVIAMPRNRNPLSRGSSSRSDDKPDAISRARSFIWLAILPQLSFAGGSWQLPVQRRVQISTNFIH
jgi:hypothetical protein